MKESARGYRCAPQDARDKYDTMTVIHAEKTRATLLYDVDWEREQEALALARADEHAKARGLQHRLSQLRFSAEDWASMVELWGRALNMKDLQARLDEAWKGLPAPGLESQRCIFEAAPLVVRHHEVKGDFCLHCREVAR